MGSMLEKMRNRRRYCRCGVTLMARPKRPRRCERPKRPKRAGHWMSGRQDRELRVAAAAVGDAKFAAEMSQWNQKLGVWQANMDTWRHRRRSEGGHSCVSCRNLRTIRNWRRV